MDALDTFKGIEKHPFDLIMEHIRVSWGGCRSILCSQKQVSKCRRCAYKCDYGTIAHREAK